MPEISRFFGIIIAIYYDDHNPPHFHARYGGQKVSAHGANRVGHEFSLRLLLGGNKVSGTLDWRFHIFRPMSQMIKSFKHKGLNELFERGSSRWVKHDLQSRSLRRLEALDQAESLTDLNVPGFKFHGLQGIPKRYAIDFHILNFKQYCYKQA